MVRTFLNVILKNCDVKGKTFYKKCKNNKNSIKYFRNMKLDIYLCPFFKKILLYKKIKINNILKIQLTINFNGCFHTFHILYYKGYL